MITPEALREEHENDFGERPAAIRHRREAIKEYCDLEVPRSLADIPDWYQRHKSVMTRRLNDLTEGSPDDNTDDEANGGEE